MLRVLLEEAGCPVEVPPEQRFAPAPAWGALHHTCHKGYGGEAAAQLLRHGADMMPLDYQGKSALGCTANQGRGGRVKLLGAEGSRSGGKAHTLRGMMGLCFIEGAGIIPPGKWGLHCTLHVVLVWSCPADF